MWEILSFRKPRGSAEKHAWDSPHLGWSQGAPFWILGQGSSFFFFSSAHCFSIKSIYFLIFQKEIYISLTYDGNWAKGIDEIIQECYNLKNDFKITIL